MPAAYRLRWLAICAALLAGWTCNFPTDQSPSVFVLVTAPRTFLLRGQRLRVQARAVRVVGKDTLVVPNVVFAWSTANPNFATVQRDTGSSATVTGVNSGSAAIIARAANFDKARQGNLAIRVANPLEIDSVRPRIVRYGELARVYGIGVDSLFLTSLAGVTLIPYPFSATRNGVTGVGRVSYWVPPPATSDSLFYLGAGVFGFTDSITKILPHDIYDPNDTIPAKINLDLGGPWPTQLPNVLFLNPALAFEETPRGVSRADWFNFTISDTTSDYTFFLTFPTSGDTTGVRTFITDSLAYKGTVPGGYFGRDSADFIGSDLMRCKGQAFSPHMAPRDSTVVALRGLPSNGPRASMHVLTFFSPSSPQRYGLAVIKGYIVANPLIQPDKYEPNRFCHYADFGNRRITLPNPGVFSDTLTIDNPHAIDWLRIDLTGGSGTTQVNFQTIGRPFTAPDTSDIDIYVLTVPNSASSTGLTLVGADTAAGSTSNITLTLNAGASYYVAVVDFAGVPTRYSLCMARAIALPSCTPIPLSAASAALRATSPVVRARRRRAGATLPFLQVAPPGAARAGTGTGGLFDPRRQTFP
jgi:hypothetical protein